MITVYHVPHTRSLRVLWLMEELGEEYRIEKLGFPLPPEYLEINPAGTVPAIDDDGIRMGESLAILQYITGRRLPQAIGITVGPNPEPADYATHLQFLHYGEASLTSAVSVIFRTVKLAPEGEKDNFSVRDLKAAFGRRLALLNAHMDDDREWIMGDKFTIADISVGYPLMVAQMLDMGDMLSDKVAAYVERLKARPAYQRAIAK
ncbi:glutathione S-transferase family protein [Altererythrobacter fulvus]|uniref:glutathione S-transferase family protein n=1 Tax=Caenibius fulvus TaxID=2126012 RepID=UPI00301903B6